MKTTAIDTWDQTSGEKIVIDFYDDDQDKIDRTYTLDETEQRMFKELLADELDMSIPPDGRGKIEMVLVGRERCYEILDELTLE